VVESIVSALATDTVRLEEQYAAVEQKILKDLDSMNIKIFSAMWSLGPRNLLEVSRQTGIPFTSVYHRIERLESKSGPVAQVIPKVSKLGMMRVVVLAAARLGCEDTVTQALRVPNLWAFINPCEGAFTHDSVHYVPVKFISEFRKYVHKLAESGLVRRFRILVTGDYIPNFPDFSYYNSGLHEWKFPWNQWFNEITRATPSTFVDDPSSYDIVTDKKDILILKELEKDARKSFSELAPIAGVSLHGVKYHFDKRLAPAGMLRNYQFNVVPFPKEVSAFHEIMLEFNTKLDLDKFCSVLPRMFFIIGASKILRRNAILIRTNILNSQLPNLFTLFSQLARAGILQSYSAIRKDFRNRVGQTVSYELFDDNKGWNCDFDQHLKELDKLCANCVIE